MVDPVVVPTRDDVVYAAAYVDGEGTLGCYSVKAGGFSQQCSITSSYLPILEWFVERWGGRIYTNRRVHPSRKPTYAWRLDRGDAMVSFLRDILPHLKEKQPQAVLMLEFASTKGREGVPTPPDIARRRHEIVSELKELKHATKDAV